MTDHKALQRQLDDAIFAQTDTALRVRIAEIHRQLAAHDPEYYCSVIILYFDGGGKLALIAHNQIVKSFAEWSSLQGAVTELSSLLKR
jgi:hypothetical protein